MRIIDEQGNELQPEEVDYDEGYLVPETIIIAHHDAIPGTEEDYHFTVKTFYFKDFTFYQPTAEDDAHIRVIDAKAGKFEYVDQGEEKVCQGMDLKRIVTVPYTPGVPAWDEYEDILRYKIFTPEEKEQHEEDKRRKEKEQELLLTGLDRLVAAETSLDNDAITLQEHTQSIAESNATIIEHAANIAENAANIVENDAKITTTNSNLDHTNNELSVANANIDDITLVLAEIIAG